MVGPRARSFLRGRFHHRRSSLRLASPLTATLIAVIILCVALPSHARSGYLTVFGDSLADGLFATHQQLGFGYQLATASGIPYTVIGVPGGSAAPGGSAWGPSIEGYVSRVPVQTTLLLVEVGTNDLGGVDASDEEFWNDYGQLITKLKARAPGAQLLCLGPWNDPAYSNAAGGTLTYFDEIVYTRCGGDAIDISNVFNGKAGRATRAPIGQATDFGPADGFHPNDYGHSWLASEASSAVASGL